MKRIKILSLLILMLWGMNATAQEEARLMRFPAIHGNRVVFTYAGDLYTVPLKGGIARKLTSHVGYEMFARFSPNGKTIAFTGQYDGNTEVFTIPSEGGIPKRITYTATLKRDDVSDRMGPNNIVMTWSRDGKYIVYRSRKQSFNSFKGQLFKVPAEGGLSEEIPLAGGGFCSFSPDAKKLAFNRVFREFRTWKYYKGGMADDIWIFDFTSKKTINITNNPAQDIFPMWIGTEIFFLSDRDRTMNLFVYDTRSKQITKLTHFTDYDIKFPSCSESSIVFERGGYLYRFDTKSRKVSKIEVTISNDLQYSRPKQVDASKRIFEAFPSPNGKRVVFSARGDIFTVPVNEGITYNLTHTSGAHERSAQWSPDGKHIAYLSDQSGEYQIYLQSPEAESKAVQLTDNQKNYIFSIDWSPDSKKILFHNRKGELLYVDTESKQLTRVAKGEFGLISDYSWSPDSRWVAYSTRGSNRFDRIYLYNLKTRKTYTVTDEWYSSYSPVFSNDGKYLLFVSDREFNPIYSDTEWNHAYSNMSRIYLVLLNRNTPSPFAPKNDRESTDNSEKTKPDNEHGKKPLSIDTEGLSSRIVSLPIEPSYYMNLSCVGNRVYYNSWNSLTREYQAKLFDLSEKQEKNLGKSISFTICSNGKKMLVHKGKQYAVIDLPRGKITIDKSINLNNMKVWIDYHTEWKQIFDESWRQMRDFFYVENMHGLNWQAIHDKYAVLVPYVNHRNDLTYIIGEMIGELNVGHAYVSGGERAKPERIAVGLLGAKLSKADNGYFRIDKILPGTSWNRSVRSPLQTVSVNAKEGDYILAVDGIDLKNINDIYSTLVGKAGKIVELSINSKPETAGMRKVLVTPIADESKLYYYSWVENNIRKVNEATNGEVGYIHIPDMGANGLNEFARHFYPQLTKKALIIDDRGNGGGNVSPMILERLSRIAYRLNMRRGLPHPYPIPEATHIGPKVLLINRYSVSDGDLFPYGFKKLGLGTVIGVRSWGGIVGISGSLPFVDGGDLRRPEFTSYGIDSEKWIIEGYGVDPDIEIDNDPYLEYMGIDLQLNKAIEVVKEKLKNWKPLPPIPPAPDKSK